MGSDKEHASRNWTNQYSVSIAQLGGGMSCVKLSYHGMQLQNMNNKILDSAQLMYEACEIVQRTDLSTVCGTCCSMAVNLLLLCIIL